MSIHEAGASMLGYLYQVRCALYLLLDNNNTSAQISIEKFDDIAFEENGTPKEMIQVKHHTIKAGSLSDKSVDLWRTIKVWIDAISVDNTLLDTTQFVIITTSKIISSTAADKIMENEYDAAYEIMKEVASGNKNEGNTPYYHAFLAAGEERIKKLLSKIKIISSTPNVLDSFDKIKKIIRVTCRPRHIDAVAERIEGWWIQEVIKALMSDDAVIMSQWQLHDKIYEISRQYDDDNLPIEFWDLNPVEEADLDPKDRVFLDQLSIVRASSKVLKIAIKDYYRATIQRSSWIRQGLVYTSELDKYESRLKNAWERAFAMMDEDLQDYGIPTDKEKEMAGRALYRKISDQDIRIRDRCCEPYVMHGTYHILANSLKVGWHIDFIRKLEHLLEGRDI